MNVTLPLGDLSVVSLTDVHSWVGGHKYKQPDLNADYGSVLSFLVRLRQYCSENRIPVFFVSNGDWIDGTALALNGDASHLIPLLEKMNVWDALNVGNHELYRNEVIDYMSRPGGYAEWWGPRLLSSNVMHASSSSSAYSSPIGNRYRVLHSADKSVLAFGFLYNMTDHGNHVHVVPVQKAVEEPWFASALQDETYDAVLVLAHMGADDPLLSVILRKIRKVAGSTMPVQFIAGHTHRRQVAYPDFASSVVESGRFLDTIGFASFPSQSTLQAASSNDSEIPGLFRHVFLDANVREMEKALGVEALMTEEGEELSKFIYRTQEEMGLHEVIGCLRKSYYLENRTTYDPDSLWRFFSENVVPTQFDSDAVVFMGQSYWRYDLLGGGDMRLDDIVAVSPFNESFVSWEEVSGDVIASINRSLNAVNSSYLPLLPNYVMASAGPFQVTGTFRLITNRFEAATIQDALISIDPNFRAAEIMNLTATEIWIRYFLRYREGCTPSSTSSKYTGTPTSGQWHNPLSGYDVSGEQLNRLLVALAIVALGLVVIVAAAYVRMRGALWKRRVERQEYATMNAMRERREFEDADEEDEII
jgi:hypothetical protein